MAGSNPDPDPNPNPSPDPNPNQANGWLLPNASDVGEGGNVNWNFSVPSLRAWYAESHAHFVRDGIDFWWNDEVRLGLGLGLGLANPNPNPNLNPHPNLNPNPNNPNPNPNPNQGETSWDTYLRWNEAQAALQRPG